MSDPVKLPLGFDDLVEGVEAALADQENGLLLIRNSLGGWMAMRFALDHPDRVHRLVLLNSAGASWEDVPDALLLPSTREEQRIKIVAMFGPDNTPLVPDFMLDPGLTSYLAHALASALDFAHTADENGVAAGIIHRDVSPSNVLLNNAGKIELADFGIAKATNLPGSIQSGALKGKVPYIN